MPALPSFTGFDTTPFPLKHWGNTQNPETILIGIHGFCGAADDFQGLARQLTGKTNKLCVYAYNLRGMGLDPVSTRIGDIENETYWIRDLVALTHQLRTHYPTARIIYCGESMGALIALQAATQSKNTWTSDKLILLSPVVDLSEQLSPLKKRIAQSISCAFPHFRIPLTELIGNQEIQVTQHAYDHYSQSQTNSWHVESFSLRFLNAIVSLVDQSHSAISEIEKPSLIVYGGKDFFTTPAQIETFVNLAPIDHSPDSLYFAESHHLILYDAQASEIFDCIAKWLEL